MPLQLIETRKRLRSVEVRLHSNFLVDSEKIQATIENGVSRTTMRRESMHDDHLIERITHIRAQAVAIRVSDQSQFRAVLQANKDHQRGVLLLLRVGIEVSVKFLRLASRERDQDLRHIVHFVIHIANQIEKLLQGDFQGSHFL